MNQSIKHQHNEIALKRLIQLKKTTRDTTVKFLLSLWKFLQGRDEKPVRVVGILSMEMWLKLGCLKSTSPNQRPQNDATIAKWKAQQVMETHQSTSSQIYHKPHSRSLR